ncbi:MAG: radical SAM protein [Deltaproteobacteria bacterium]|nr:radical SAM protein [Deltaproteobacteria bacterium]
MKVSISYPPLESKKGAPLLSQNRQFQWFKDPTYIYPVIPAYAATFLKENGFDVLWDDGIAESLTYDNWLKRLKDEEPDIVVLETKTPVVKRHWKIISDIKKISCESKNNVNLKNNYHFPIVILMGDHVTAMPEESLINSEVDFVITGGDYDFSILGLCKVLKDFSSLDDLKNIPSGIYYRNGQEILNSGKFKLDNDLNELPYIDRNLTNWKLYAYKNGNFKHTPGTYVMAGRDCWYGRCSFCSWTTLYPGKNFRTVNVSRYLDEIGMLIEEFKVKEIFDDSGCFPIGDWLKEFCEGMIKRKYNKKVVMGGNMRVGALSQKEWNLLRQANFRMILIGLESIVPSTLKRLNKGINVSDIEPTLKMAKQAGLEPQLTTMIGYPWETKEEAIKTIEFAKYLFKKGYIDKRRCAKICPKFIYVRFKSLFYF